MQLLSIHLEEIFSMTEDFYKVYLYHSNYVSLIKSNTFSVLDPLLK